MKEYFSVHQQRQMNQISLNKFTHGKDNILNYPVDTPIEEIKTKVIKAYAKHNERIVIQKNKPELFKELEELAKQKKNNIQLQMYCRVKEIIDLEDELFDLLK